MRKFTPIVLLLVLFMSACKTNSSNTQKNQIDTFGTAKHYQKYQRNIDRLYHMLQGTFICYSKAANEDTPPVVWKIDQDSIITYSIPIKEPAKDGYWLICYQFITSLPNKPIYCALQRITPIDRDTFLSEFFNSPTEIKLSDILKDLKKVEQSIDLKKLTLTDEIITHYREEITVFKGSSNIYKDHQNQKLAYRRDDYQVYPDRIKLSAKYFSDTEGKRLTQRVARTLISIRTQKKVSDMIDESLLKE